jgi:hypothetical protein
VTSDDGNRHARRTGLDSRWPRRADKRQRVAPRSVDSVDEMMVLAQITMVTGSKRATASRRLSGSCQA